MPEICQRRKHLYQLAELLWAGLELTHNALCRPYRHYKGVVWQLANQLERIARGIVELVVTHLFNLTHEIQ